VRAPDFAERLAMASLLIKVSIAINIPRALEEVNIGQDHEFSLD